jgi:hypothetical protein
MSDGFVFPVGIWSKPSGPEGSWWEVPRADVLATIREAFARYDVARLYADPHEWRTDIDDLAEDFPERVVAWETRRDVAMAAALDRLHTGLRTGELWHSGDPLVVEHFANAYVRRKGGHRLVRKEHDQSPARSTPWWAPRWPARPAPMRWRPAGGSSTRRLTRVSGRVRSY